MYEEDSPEVAAILDIFANNHQYGWELARIDRIYVWIKCIGATKGPHVRIRRDNGCVEALGGIQLTYNGIKLGQRITCEEFIRIVTDGKVN